MASYLISGVADICTDACQVIPLVDKCSSIVPLNVRVYQSLSILFGR